MTAPKLIRNVVPEYTDEARRAKLNGDVTVWMFVDTDGTPKQVRVMKALGMGLDQNAVAAVKQWRFEPATKDGVPVRVELTAEVSFRLY